jgi:GDPmannose 4,6-dehydratase
MKTAVISGITGMDASHLAEFLLEKDYRVIGFRRRNSTNNLERIEHLLNNENFIIEYADLADQSSLDLIVDKYKPDEFYHLAAQSDVRISFDTPIQTADITGLGTLRVLEAIRRFKKDCKVYSAISSEIFGKVQEIPQKETTPFYPRSPYGVSKLFSFWISKNYRESYNMFICSGILFNHFHFNRGSNFVEQKVVKGLIDIYEGKKSILELGNIYSQRDWGSCKDYIKGMYLMLQQDIPDDYVLATNETHSVAKLIALVGRQLNWDIRFSGKDLDLIGYIYKDENNKQIIIKVNPEFYRPAEVDLLIGDYSKAKEKLGWVPEISLEELVQDMMDSDLKLFERDKYLLEGGHNTFSYFE